MAKNEIDINPVGRLVMVPPELTTDPANMQGETGRVIGVLSGASVLVRFGAGMESPYQNDALLTLASKKTILIGLQRNPDIIRPFEQKMILKVLRLILEKEPERALKYALDADITTRYCTISLQDWIERKTLQKELNKGRTID